MEELVGARRVSWASVTVATAPSTVGENAPSDQNRFVADPDVAPDDGLDSYLEIDLGWAWPISPLIQIWNPGRMTRGGLFLTSCPFAKDVEA